MKKRRILLITIIYWISAGLAPLICVFFEFGWRLGFDYAKFYSPLFFYPLIFGLFSVYFSLRTILFFLALPRRQRFDIPLSGLMLFFLTSSILITGVELSGRPAIWEVKKEAIENSISAIVSPNREINSWDQFIEHFREHPETPKLSDFYGDRSAYQEELTKLNALREEFNEIIIITSKNIGNWSFTRYFYVVSFFVQQFALLCLFTTISFISIPKFQAPLDPEETTAFEEDFILVPGYVRQRNPEPSEKFVSLKKHYILLSISLFFGLAWLSMRLAFDTDKLNLYGENLVSTSAATFVIGIAYVLAMIYLTVRLWLVYQETFQVIYNLAAAIIGLALTFLSTRSGGNFLGSNASPQNYVICIAAVAIILFPWYIAYRDTLDQV